MYEDIKILKHANNKIPFYFAFNFITILKLKKSYKHYVLIRSWYFVAEYSVFGVTFSRIFRIQSNNHPLNP